MAIAASKKTLNKKKAGGKKTSSKKAKGTDLLDNVEVMLKKVGDLVIHPFAQRNIVISRLQRMAENLDIKKIGVLHAVRYPIKGVTKTWIVDGQHRLRALGDNGHQNSKVVVALHKNVKDDAGASALFLGLNDRATVNPYDRFANEVRADDPDALGIIKIARKNSLEIGSYKADGKMVCIKALKSVYAKDQGETLELTLDVITAAWGRKREALDGKIIEGLGAVLKKYAPSIDIKELTEKLTAYPGGPTGLMGKAKGWHLYQATSIVHCVAEAIVEMYNQGKRKNSPDRLDSIRVITAVQ